MWVLYYWQDEIRDGERIRVKVSKRIGKATDADRIALLEDEDYVPRGIRRDAQPILDAANSQAEIPIRDSKRSITFAEFIPEWRRLAAPSLKPSTLKGMESVIRAHLIPALGDVPITNLDVRRVQELISSLVDKTAKGTRENIFGDLQTILNAARKWHNNIPDLKRGDIYFGIKKAGEGRKAVFTIPQVKAILKELESRPKWYVFFLVLAGRFRP